MKRDSIFYKLFKQSPGLLFELTDPSFPNADRYRFDSVEVKETAFRIDGVFLPPEDAVPKVVFFGEVQFQKDERLYKRFFAELFVFLGRSEVAYDDWGGVLIFGSRSMEPSVSVWYRSLLASGQVVRVYLDEIEDWQNQPVAVSLALLTIGSDEEAIERAKALVRREEAIGWQLDIMGLVSTIMLYRFPDLGWEGVEAMFNIQDVRLEDTRAYREIAEKQTQSVQVKFVLMQLNEKLGKLPDNLQARVSVLPSEALDTIGRALLYFQNIQDLIVWLDEET